MDKGMYCKTIKGKTNYSSNLENSLRNMRDDYI